MIVPSVTAREATLLFRATIAVSMAGIFFGIFFMFMNTDLAVRIAAALMVGLVGIISFLRHSVCYRSDQVRMGWHQDHPEFQIEVGFANLAMGIWALVVAAFNWGAAACGITLAIYGTYLFCTLVLHASQARSATALPPADRERAVRSVFSTGFFVLFLLGFAILAFARAGFIPFLQM
jgi:hypothetical protein